MNISPEVTIGNLLTIFAMLVGGLSAVLKIVWIVREAISRAQLVEERLGEMQLDFEKRHKELHLDIQRVEGKVEVIAVVQQQLIDGKDRMNRLEERIRDLERKKA